MGVRTPDMAPYRTIDQAAEQLRVSRKTLQNWIRAGHIHKYKIPGDKHTYLDIAEVKAYRKPHRRDQPPGIGGGAPVETYTDSVQVSPTPSTPEVGTDSVSTSAESAEVSAPEQLPSPPGPGDVKPVDGRCSRCGAEWQASLGTCWACDPEWISKAPRKVRVDPNA